jgi:hypothetical protein
MIPSIACPQCGGTGSIMAETALAAARRRGLVIRYRDLPAHLRARPPHEQRCAALSLSTRQRTRGLSQCRLPPMEGAEFCAEHRALVIKQLLERAARKIALDDRRRPYQDQEHTG